MRVSPTIAVCAALWSVPTAGAAAAAPATGVYTGPAGTAEHDTFSAWLGTPSPYAVDFVDDSQSWTNIAKHSDWLADPWSAWVKAKDGRRLVVSVPMLNRASAGRLVDGADGAFDQHFRTLAQELVDDGLGNAIIRLGWEANGDWYPWRASPNPAAWKAFFRRIVRVMRSVPAQSFDFDLTYNRGRSGTRVSFETIYPGDDVVDILGMDVYDTRHRDDTSPPEVRWAAALEQEMGLNDFKAFAAAHRKPMSIPEWALWERDHDDNGGVGDNPYFIDGVADWLQDNAADVVYHGYFNHLSGWTGDHRLASYANARARYRQRFGPPAAGPDVTPPAVAITTPRDDTPAAGVVQVAATASDGGGVAGVQFLLDGADLGAEDRYAPFALRWDSRRTPDGMHVITAIARDAAGNVTNSTAQTVDVRNRQ
jgi:hypothetical protein